MFQEDVTIKSELINPTKKDKSIFYKKLNKDLRLGNISKDEYVYMRTKVNARTDLCNDYEFYGLDTLADMLWVELMAELNLTQSIEGAQSKNLGSTTGHGRQEIVSKTPEEKA